MSNDSHERFEELAAGFALDALDADDEQAFRAHLATCSRCRARVAEFLAVAADLATVNGEDPEPNLRDQILAAALAVPDLRSGATADPAADGAASLEPGAPVVTLFSHRRRQRVRLLAAAAVVVVAGVVGGLIATSRGIGQPPANCSASTACTRVILTSAISHRAVATVIVSQREVWIRPQAIPVNDATKRIYVLWEIVGHGAPRAVGAFDVVHGADGTIAVGSTEGDNAPAFAVSLEPGRRIPRSPSNTVAIGRVA